MASWLKGIFGGVGEWESGTSVRCIRSERNPLVLVPRHTHTRLNKTWNRRMGDCHRVVIGRLSTLPLVVKREQNKIVSTIQYLIRSQQHA